MESTRYSATFRDEQKAIELGELEFGLEYIHMYVKEVGEATPPLLQITLSRINY
jgi:hypothetical protein